MGNNGFRLRLCIRILQFKCCSFACWGSPSKPEIVKAAGRRRVQRITIMLVVASLLKL